MTSSDWGMGESIGHISIHEAMTNTWYHISILIYSIMKKFLNIIFLDSLHKNKKSLFMDSEVYITKTIFGKHNSHFWCSNSHL